MADKVLPDKLNDMDKNEIIIDSFAKIRMNADELMIRFAEDKTTVRMLKEIDEAAQLMNLYGIRR